MIRRIALGLAVALFATTGVADAKEYWVKAGASGKGVSKDDPAGVLQPLLAKAKRGQRNGPRSASSWERLETFLRAA